ncbi:histone deacetylase complex subunit SAP18 [Pieris napi]|nr:histone deacetylase complex subunit SAP18 [Pieris rapae]XP_045523282.1 histone deacetylase complex subunit SAP18 isoform X2 [Pieris brassicae]XP_047516370.1 histone deacetylase complex subunit SAP18 [Pieris napi]XP_047516378.1 histone deacetylase complex subunit SAP18 [Pieris napi]CAF4851676.1 unnamed protein product [Pieris macdunnoughi]
MKMAGVESMVVEEVKPAEKPVDREKTCPLLLRVFCSTGRHNSPGDYARGGVPQNELQIYTWMDATLRELTSLVKEVNPETRRKGTYFDFAIVYPDMRTPTYRMREIGVTCSGQRGNDDNKTLSQVKFQIGNYLDISITPANRMPPPMRRPQPYMNNRPY